MVTFSLPFSLLLLLVCFPMKRMYNLTEHQLRWLYKRKHPLPSRFQFIAERSNKTREKHMRTNFLCVSVRHSSFPTFSRLMSINKRLCLPRNQPMGLFVGSAQLSLFSQLAKSAFPSRARTHTSSFSEDGSCCRMTDFAAYSNRHKHLIEAEGFILTLETFRSYANSSVSFTNLFIHYH